MKETIEAEENPELTELALRYKRALHAMQAGVKTLMLKQSVTHLDPDTREVSPKHLRVGLNNAMIEFGALTELLFETGVVDKKAFYEKLVKFTENEVRDYEQELGVKLGTFY